jgi:(hydroxyamino)benzene mutase
MDTLLLQIGTILFMIGLITGFIVPRLKNPRMGLASHLEGILNGIFLIVLGLLWQKLSVSDTLLRVTFWLAIYGSFANWLATLLAAMWGAGSMMPIAAMGNKGSTIQELVVGFLLATLSMAMISVCVIVIIGLNAQ